MRLSSVNMGALFGLAAIATTTRSKIVAARRTRSWWPFVIGSNVPGYTALRFMLEKMIPDLAGPAFFRWSPRRRQPRQAFPRRAFDIDERCGREPAALLELGGAGLEQVARSEWRIEEHDVERLRVA